MEVNKQQIETIKKVLYKRLDELFESWEDNDDD